MYSVNKHILSSYYVPDTEVKNMNKKVYLPFEGSQSSGKTRHNPSSE